MRLLFIVAYQLLLSCILKVRRVKSSYNVRFIPDNTETLNSGTHCEWPDEMYQQNMPVLCGLRDQSKLLSFIGCMVCVPARSGQSCWSSRSAPTWSNFTDMGIILLIFWQKPPHSISSAMSDSLFYLVKMGPLHSQYIINFHTCETPVLAKSKKTRSWICFPPVTITITIYTYKAAFCLYVYVVL